MKRTLAQEGSASGILIPGAFCVPTDFESRIQGAGFFCKMLEEQLCCGTCRRKTQGQSGRLASCDGAGMI
ncbi:MAG: hypothetical protein Q4C59_12650 [Lachnospiraceae bacterium]|nr:hypothetical protein [Lachnospiraceae bacterium]